MGIAPLDLQTLFSQVDKVGKAQAAQKDGQVLHQVMQGVQIQKKADEQMLQVNQAQNQGDGADKVKDRGPNHGHGGEQGSGKNKNRNENPEEEKKHSYFNDPNLGKKIDISL